MNSGGEELRELCQQISNEVDSEDFEPLVSKLNQVLDQMGAKKQKRAVDRDGVKRMNPGQTARGVRGAFIMRRFERNQSAKKRHV